MKKSKLHNPLKVKKAKIIETKENKQGKLKKNLKIIGIICVSIIILELAYIMYVKISKYNSTTYYDSINMVQSISDGYIAVGSSDFYHSRYNNYADGLEKAKLVKYAKDGTIIFEKKYEKGYNTTFHSVLVTADGYLVTGSGEFDKEQNKESIRDALLVKYDNKGNIVWSKTYQELGNSKFLKAISIDDGYIVIGRSIYANNVLGNGTTGGAIIIKYDLLGNIVWTSNWGGNKSGIYSDIIAVDDGYIAVGKDAVNTGIVTKFNLDGEKLWNRLYNYTDNIGFTGVTRVNDGFVVVGAKMISGDEEGKKIPDYDALIVRYDNDGNIIFEDSYNSGNIDRFNTIISDEDSLIIVGYSGNYDEKESTDKLNVFKYDGIVFKYNLDNKVLLKKTIGGTNDDYFNNIIKIKDGYVISCYTNSKDKELSNTGGNGKDYFPRLIKLNNSFEFEKIISK